MTLGKTRHFRGISSVGRALALQARGHGFKSYIYTCVFEKGKRKMKEIWVKEKKF